MNRLFIIDIDGCILENIFSNFGNNFDDKLTLKEIKKRLKKIDLFQDFYDFLYYQIRDNDKILFLTGRKRLELGKITKKQLKPLKNMLIDFKIVFYPDNKEITPANYYEFKTNWCNFAINSCFKKYQFEKKIIIIDDIDDYFENIIDLIDVKFFKIENENTWYEITNILNPNDKFGFCNHIGF